MTRLPDAPAVFAVEKLILLSLLLIALTALIAACGPAGNEPAAVRQGGGVTEVKLAKLPDSREGNAAATAGTLRTEGACLYLEAAGSARYLIAFTIPGARWDAARGALVVPSGRAEAGEAMHRPGERVTLGGSEAGAEILAPHWVEPPAATCDTRRIWIANSIDAAGSS